MSKKQDTSGTVKKISTQKWADKVTISDNSKQEGIELRFNAEPSPELQPKLRAMGFRHSKSQVMWYGENTSQAIKFAKQVEDTISLFPEGPDLFLSPTFDAVKTNIEKKEFSYVMITLKDGQVKNFVVFEPSKPKAEVIASNFARKEFGDQFLVFAAKPRLHVKEARILFDEGRIIFPEGQDVPTHKASAIKGLKPEYSEPAIEETYEIENDNRRELETVALQKLYKWATLQPDLSSKPSNLNRETFDNWLKENYPQLNSTSLDNMWRSHERVMKSFKRLGKRSTGKPLAQPYSSNYKKLMQIIPDLIKHIDEGKQSGKSVKDPKGGLMDLNFDYLGKDKKGNYLIALSHYFKQNGDMVPDPDMQIRILPEKEMVEAMTFQDQFGYKEVYPNKGDGKEYVNPRLKKDLNQFLSQWLTNIIRQGHKIDLTQQESEIELSEEETPDYSRLAYNMLVQFIPDLLLNSEIERKGELITQKRTIHCTISPKQKNQSLTIFLTESVNDKEQLQSDIDIELDKQLASVSAEWLSDPYAERYDREESYEEIEDRDGDIGEEMTRGLTEWLDDVIDLGHIELKPSSIDNIDKSEVENNNPAEANSLPALAIQVDLKSGDTFLPNVLVPAGTKEPFLSQNFHQYDMKSVLKTNFPHLLKLNEKNLSKASALEMFELVQMAHPNEYGINVNRIAMLEEWEKRGRKLFEDLGFPTDSIYPYVNIHIGYESVESLNELLFDSNKEGNDWWAVAEHWRPIADIKKAHEIIEQQIKKEKEERKGLTNPKTKKPKLEYKQLARDIEYIIESLEDSKTVIQHYIDNPAETNHAEKTAKEPIIDSLANEQGVYTEKTTGKNYEKIVIPMPKAAQYEAEITIVKTSNANYKIGLLASKKFGDHNGLMFGASVEGQPYSTRGQALMEALKYHKLKLELLLIEKDNILSNEEKKNKCLNTALQALIKFAEENNVTLKDLPSGKNSSTKTPLKEAGIIKGLETTYWTEEDENDESAQTKFVIDGIAFHALSLQERLLEEVKNKPLEKQIEIADLVSKEFKATPLNDYTTDSGKTIKDGGLPMKKQVVYEYFYDLSNQIDFRNPQPEKTILRFLMDLLIDKQETLVDKPASLQPKENKANAKPKKISQLELNKSIEAFIDKKDNEKSFFNEEEKNYIRQYTGSGGLISQGASGRGILYEYYTTENVVKRMWDMAFHFGYDGGSILEPSVGTGNFLKYAPKGATVFGFETNHYSARIAQILYPTAHIHEKAFETLFFAGNVHLKDNFNHPPYSLVIGNPPYGEFSGKYAGMGEKKWTGAAQYEHYFTLRGLDLLKSGGLLIYIVPSNFLRGSSFINIAKKIASKCEGLDRYTLGTGIFKTTDIETDIIALRKI